MDPARFEQIEHLFAALQDVPAPRRAARLAELTNDEEVRREVIALLEHDDELAFDGLREQIARAIDPVLAGSTGHAPASIGGRPEIPGFELREVIGAGAMGVVYRAVQQSPRRDVAIKMVRAAPGLSRRFRSEGEALARLQHPGVATVFSVGVIDSPDPDPPRPYIVMELVEGRRLDQWVSETSPSLEDRLHLMLSVCDAVQHAHARGVIHRDLKPSNILITGAGEPKVIDFGVARLEDAGVTLETSAGELVGTIAYMSPEQLSGDPLATDTRSDVYALGVVLFNVLTGQLPHEVSALSITAAARTVVERAPRKLSAADPALRARFGGDLETVVAHALERDKDRRYQTAEALKDDLRRCLAGLPINARPPSTLYVLRRLARRHRPAVAAVALGVLALVAASAIAAFSAVSAGRSATLAGTALGESRKAERRAENINEFLIGDLLTGGLSRRLGVNARVIDVVDNALPLIAERFKDDPIGEAKVRITVAQVLAEGGRAEETLEQVGLGLAALRGAGQGDRREAVVLVAIRGNIYLLMGRPDEAEAHVREALALAERAALPGDDPVVVETWCMLGSVLQAQGKHDEAEPILRGAVATMLAKGEPYPTFLIGSLTHLVQIAKSRGRGDEVARLAREIRHIAESRDDPAARIIAATYEAEGLEMGGDPAAAIEARLRAVEIAREFTEPASVLRRMAVIYAAHSLAKAQRHQEGIPLMLEGLELIKGAVGEFHYEVERTCAWLAKAYLEGGDPAASARWRERELVLRYYIAGPGEFPSLLDVFERGGTLLGSSEAFVGVLLAECEKTVDTPAQRPAFLANVARVLAHRDDPRAGEVFSAAFDAFDLTKPERGEDVLMRLDDWSAGLERSGRQADAEAWRARLALARSQLP